MTLVASDDPRFRYDGRFATADAGPLIVWQASRIALDFEGDALELMLGEAVGQNFFDVAIDGRVSIAAVGDDGPARGMRFERLGPGRHRLLLTKRSEAAAGTARFTGVRVAEGAGVFAPDAPEWSRRFQFFGDSITAGACNEDGADDQWETRRTHNACLSYAALTAEAFAADHRNIAISGMGIAAGFVDVRAGEVWDRVRPEATAPRADLTTWTPDVVFFNYGENDAAFTALNGLGFPAEAFVRGYVDLVRAVRAAWPQAYIVILRGGMSGGAQSEPLRTAWEKVVDRLEKEDARVAHYVFKHWTWAHPRVKEHRIMSGELTAWLRTQPFAAGWEGAAVNH